MKTKRAFKVKWKTFFIIFKGVSVARICLRPESVPLKARKRRWHYFILLCQSRNVVGQAQKSLFAKTNQVSTFSHTHENSKIFKITSKYFTFSNNKQPPASWDLHIARDFLACYFCSYRITNNSMFCIINIKFCTVCFKPKLRVSKIYWN